MKERRDKYQKVIDELYARTIQIDESEQTLLGEFINKLREDAKSDNSPLTEFITSLEFNTLGSLEVGESANFRFNRIKRLN